MSDKSIAEKLFLKPGRNLMVVNPPAGYPQKMEPLPEFAKFVDESDSADVLMLFVRSSAELSALFKQTVSQLCPETIFWVAYPKLNGALKGDLSRDILVSYALSLHWKGVFMISLDEDWSALRLVTQ
jgi:hypothetical protein